VIARRFWRWIWARAIEDKRMEDGGWRIGDGKTERELKIEN
jgi:hypothetical protein